MKASFLFPIQYLTRSSKQSWTQSSKSLLFPKIWKRKFFGFRKKHLTPNLNYEAKIPWLLELHFFQWMCFSRNLYLSSTQQVTHFFLSTFIFPFNVGCFFSDKKLYFLNPPLSSFLASHKLLSCSADQSKLIILSKDFLCTKGAWFGLAQSSR